VGICGGVGRGGGGRGGGGGVRVGGWMGEAGGVKVGGSGLFGGGGPGGSGVRWGANAEGRSYFFHHPSTGHCFAQNIRHVSRRKQERLHGSPAA